MIEVAWALVPGFRVIKLDEPASGLDNNGDGVSDNLYVLDHGRIVAQGGPEDIQRDPAVIAATWASLRGRREPVG